MKKKLVTLSGLVLGFSPVVAFAQVSLGGNPCKSAELGGLICKVNEIFGLIVPVLVALGIIYFVWGIITYVIADDEETKSAGRSKIIYGIIGLAVIVSMWGLVRILTRTAGVDNNPTGIQLPYTP